MTVATLEEAADLVEPGMTLGLGGKTIHRAPMAFVRALARRSIEGVNAIGLAKSMDVDLLCGTGGLDRVYYGYVGFEWLGLAPNFRRAAESGRVTPVEGSCYTVATMFRGAAQGVPFMPVAGMDGSDLPDAVAEPLESIACPYTGEAILTVPTVRPDVGVVHAVAADRHGNAVLAGGDLTEGLVARASRRVVVTAERIVEDASLEAVADLVPGGAASPHRIHLPGVLVDVVVEAPYGAHPTSCPGIYEYDRDHLGVYLERSRAGELDDYIERFLGETESAYRRAAVEGREGAIEWDVAVAGDLVSASGAGSGSGSGSGRCDPAPDVRVTAAETMTVALARRLVEGDARTVFQGFASPLPTVAIRLARELRPDIVHLSASGAVDAAPRVMPTSTEDQHLFEGATGAFTSPECFDLAARGELDVMFVGSPQIDRRGRLNGSVVGSWDEPMVKFPGSGGTASLLPLIDAGYGWRTEHSPRTLPESVDFVTADGNLAVLVTPLCTFERVDGELVVAAIHPGATAGEIREATGWDVTIPSPTRLEPPTDRELELLDRLDPSRIRRSGFPDGKLAPVPGR